MYRCDDCESIWTADQLLDIDDYFQRVTPGGKVPDGQCRECGALCFEDETPADQAAERVRRAGPELLAALEAVLRLAEATVPYCLSVAMDAGNQEVLKAARAAIRRAKGGIRMRRMITEEDEIERSRR